MKIKTTSIAMMMHLCLIAIVSSLAFTSCDKDDDGNSGGSINPDDIIGRWEVVEDRLNGQVEDTYESGDFGYQFNSDGTGLCWAYGYEVDITWRLDGNQITIIETGYEDDGETLTISELTSTRLVFEARDEDGLWEEVYRRID